MSSSSSSSSTSSYTETDTDSSDAPLSVIAAKLNVAKKRGRKRKSSGDTVIMAKKVIDYMKFQTPNGTTKSMTHYIDFCLFFIIINYLGYREHFKLKPNYMPKSISSSKLAPKSNSLVNTHENQIEMLKNKTPKISKVNPKKRWLNGIDHMMNIHQPEKGKTRLPGKLEKQNHTTFVEKTT